MLKIFISTIILFNITFSINHLHNPGYLHSKYFEKCSPYKTYYIGPKGGCYYINKNGNKTYVSHSCCGTQSSSSAPGFTNESGFLPPSQSNCNYNGNKLYTGPKGGCYYYSQSGNRQYVERSRCNNC